MRVYILGVVITAAFLFASTAALGGPGVWTSSGPEGGNVQNLAVSPDQPERIYLASVAGLFRSDNEGQSWTGISSGLPSAAAFAIATAPTDADRVVVGLQNRLYRSDDAGSSWMDLSPGWLPEWGFVQAIHIDAANPDTMLASGHFGGLRRSTDGGANWARIDDETRFEGVGSFLVLPGDPDTVFLVAKEFGADGLAAFRTTDGGVSWDEMFSDQVFSMTRFFAGNDDTVLAVPGSWISDDKGASWSTLDMPVGLVFGPLVAALDPNESDSWYLGGTHGLIHTDDGGETYSIVSDGMGPSGAGGYNAGATALALKPGSFDVLLVGSEHTGFYRSANGGETWQRRNNGLLGVNVRSLAVNPINSSIIYAGQGDATNGLAENLWATFDGGASWAPSNAGLEASGVRGLALDPNTAANPVTSVLYAVGWSLPLYDVSLPMRPVSGGVFKSSSGAGSWDDIGADLPLPSEPWQQFSLLRTVALDPGSGSGIDGDGPLQTVYIGGSGYIDYVDDGSGNIEPEVVRARIYRSDNAGDSWQPADSGLPISPWLEELGAWFNAVIQLHVDPTNPDTLYAATILAGSAALMAAETPTLDNGVFKSTDGGQNWSLASNGLPRHDESEPDSSHWNVLALALAPSAPNTLYAVASPLGEFRPSIMFRSNDGGDNWLEVNTGIPDDIDIRWIEVDPLDPDLVYVAGGGTIDNPGSVFRTENGGQEWVSYSIGLPASSATVLAIDRSGPNPVVHAGTFGGVYSIEQVPDEDIDGVPDAIEDGAPNGGDGNGDGIPDSMQADVASLLAPAGNRSARRGISDYITVELVEQTRSQCSRLMSVHALSENQFPIDSGFEYPYGLLRFEIPDCPGAAIRITFHDLAGTQFDEQWGFRIYAPDEPGDVSTMRWQYMPAAEPDGNSWILTLNDGQLGDLRPANNRILFQGGPARLPDNRLFHDRFEPAVVQAVH